ncbi:phosphoribosyl transferase [Scytonema hofmannii PCC 7110]|uniref:Phosphoribosyl transferase n=1 Tax=Scytonema hofmannii PCC 7110 TaxID=128403 RepID=A0A139X7U4_9CYAN|nr:phosphoribosyltransferase [Scytonema hofmannii]KYC40781.1 phosphoribosyl transferase [Scytonema hofmannii PCC 7110]
MRFKDRTQAGQFLAKELAAYANRPDTLVLGIPRGGVPVAFEIAKTLNTPLDIFVVRKLGVPDQRELAMGAIASGGVRVLNEDIVRSLHISEVEIDQVTEKEQQELERREHLYRGDRPFPQLHEQTVILVDDGLATGATMRASVVALQKYKPAKTVIAVPVSALETRDEFAAKVDEIICGLTPSPFYSVGLWYEDFPQTTDEEVRNLLDRAANRELLMANG